MTSPHPQSATSHRTEVIGVEPAQALAGVLDLEPPATGIRFLPPLWHWIYLLERPSQKALGPDGHPTTGIPAPPGPGRLRMFAGGRVTTHSELLFGQLATKTTRVLRSVEKQGRSGPLTFVTVHAEIEQAGEVVITEEQDIVYREGARSLQSAAHLSESASFDEPGPGEFCLKFDVNEVLLFRFSALTYNAHRIHYDQKYAAEEGYPDLVVHGPLQALLMGEAMRRSGLDMLGREFAYRLVAPTYGVQRLTVSVSDTAKSVEAQVRDRTGRVTALSTLSAVHPG